MLGVGVRAWVIFRGLGKVFLDFRVKVLRRWVVQFQVVSGAYIVWKSHSRTAAGLLAARGPGPAAVKIELSRLSLVETHLHLTVSRSKEYKGNNPRIHQFLKRFLRQLFHNFTSP